MNFDVSPYPQLPPLPGFFVTATDTEVGKTLVAGGIARTLSLAGKKVGVFKPVASGCGEVDGVLYSPDGAFLAQCAGGVQTQQQVVPVRLGPALSPNVAAHQSGCDVSLGEIFAGYLRMAEMAPDVVVAEGVGGLLCPITDDFWVIHLAKMLALPLVIVTRPGLGTINHTLLTIHAARSAGLEIAGVVINRYDPESACGDSAASMRTNPTQIAQRGDVDILGMIPNDPQSNVETGQLGPLVAEAIASIDLSRWC